MLPRLGTSHISPNIAHPEINHVHNRILEVLDKGKAAAVTAIAETRDTQTGQLIFENQSTVFIRGSGGFGGKRVGKGNNYPDKFQNRDSGSLTDRGPATASNTPPKRAPDAVVEEKTSPSQAALYR